MKLDPAQQLTVRRIEDAFAREYLGKAVKSLPFYRKISLKLGSREVERFVTEKAHQNLMKDIETGDLPKRYETEVVSDWDNRRKGFIGGLNLKPEQELQNLEALTQSFKRAKMLNEGVERPDYMRSPYDPLLMMLRK